tara:strand:- start:13886 stop:15346 length:1461 start_codon:yes stop_codon:yes gene_type:complete
MYILEMANNHMGDLEHGKRIVKSFAEIVQKYKVNAAVKLQFRQLDTFIHKDFVNSDLKQVKRFKETRLSKHEFQELVDCVKNHDLKTCSTAFDNESISWLEDLDVSIVKVASCSIDDWPLLQEISDINKKIIISTAGADIENLRKVYELFKSKDRDFAFMHCVADYPTPHNKANLKRISTLKNEFPDIEIGYSTHESPNEKTAVYATIMGCNIIEKHVGVSTEKYDLNAYSLSPEHFENFLRDVEHFHQSLSGKSETQSKSLRSLKRGVYFSKDMNKGSVVSKEDIYYAMPAQELECDHHFDASSVDDIVDRVLLVDTQKDSVVASSILGDAGNELLQEIKSDISDLLIDANIEYKNQEIEISCHYGLESFKDIGCVIITKVNRDYCKKLIVCLPSQSHPSHRHIKKEECFELIYGDCTLKLDHEEIKLAKGKPVLIPVGVNHSFKSQEGCVVEEISTRHIKGDSIYSDSSINKLTLEQRKIITKL